MLKRNDLAKQFELVVQQEIINHNEQILASNLSINEMRILIDDMQKKQDLVNQTLASTLSRMNQNSVELSETILKLTQKFCSFTNDMNDFREKVKYELKISVENAVSAHSKNEISLNHIEYCRGCIVDLEDSIVGLSFTFSQELQEDVKNLKKEIAKSKNEILSLPSEAQKIKSELEEKISISQIDFQGLKKEIDYLKHSLFVKEKHIEHLFTQIERIKAGKP